MKYWAASSFLCGLLGITFASYAVAQTYSREAAARYMSAQNWAGLAQYASGWTRAEPNDPDGWAYLGMAYGLHLHDPARAASAIHRSLQLNPNQPDGWEALGVAYIDLKQYPDAVIAIRRAIQMNPHQYAFYNNLAAAYAAQADWQDSLRTLEQEESLAARLNNAEVWYVLGNGYLRLENAQKAVSAYQQCLRLKPNFGAGWTNLGVALAWGGNARGALNAYDRGAALGDPLARKNAAELRQTMVARKNAAAGSANRIDNNANWLSNHAYGIANSQRAAHQP